MPIVPIVGRLAVFVGHFEEDQIGELFQVVAVADAVIAEGMAEAPDFGYNAGRVHGVFFFLFLAVFFLTFIVASSLAFSALMRSSSFSAGSSLGSCGTSLPSNAFFRMLWRNASAWVRLSSMVCSILSQTERRDSISE